MVTLKISDGNGRRAISCPTLVDSRRAICAYAIRTGGYMNTNGNNMRGIIATPGTGVVLASWEIVPA